MPNKENIEELIVFMESEEHPWDISGCQTCFIGQASILFGKEQSLYDLLDLKDASRVFSNENLVMPPHWDTKPEDYPRSRAIAQLKHIRETGEVDWAATPVNPHSV